MCWPIRTPKKVVVFTPSLGQLLDTQKRAIFEILRAEIDQVDECRVKTVSLVCTCEFTTDFGPYSVVHSSRPYFLEPDLDILYDYLKEDLLDFHYQYVVDNYGHKFSTLIRCNVRFFSDQI